MRAFLVASSLSSAFVIASLTIACTSPSTGTSSGNGTSGSPSAEGGSSGSSGSSGAGGGVAGALPVTTFLYVSKAASDRDVLMAYDVASGEVRTITDLRGDGSEGWSIDGYSLSPDRTRIAISSNYGPTKADNDTQLATQRIWTFAADGSDFRRLTPVFPNTGAGRKQFVIEIRNPTFSQSGADVLYNYGEYWYEGTTLTGGSGIWSVGAAGGGLPDLFVAPNPCSVVDPSVDPSTGKVAVIHSVCTGAQDGIYLYAADGSGAPEKLVGSDYATVDVALEPPRWAADGSGFTFIGTTPVTINGSSVQARSLFVFDMQARKAIPVVVPQVADVWVVDATAAPDASAIVYCLAEGEARNLHVIDLTKDPATDAAITTDGKSCHPVW